HHRFLVLNCADVVEADVPFVTGAVKNMSISTGDIVTFEHEHSFMGIGRKQGSGGEPADTGANDDRVPGLIEGKLFKRSEFHVDTPHIILSRHVAIVNMLY